VNRRAAVLAAWLAALGAAGSASAGPNEEQLGRGVAALERGAVDEAIDDFELLADRGFVHPDASFDRGLGYVARARSPQARPGDLGKAAAAFAETLWLRPADAEAESALELVTTEIARRRAREGTELVAARPSLGRAVAGLLSEGAWSVGAALGSLLLSLGLALRLFGHKSHTLLSGAVTASIGAAALVLCGSLAFASGRYRCSSQPAVVVVAEARLLDERGVPVPQSAGHAAIPEGATVYLLGRRGSRSRVEWGSTEAWVESADIRTLASR